MFAFTRICPVIISFLIIYLFIFMFCIQVFFIRISLLHVYCWHLVFSFLLLFLVCSFSVCIFHSIICPFFCIFFHHVQQKRMWDQDVYYVAFPHVIYLVFSFFNLPHVKSPKPTYNPIPFFPQMYQDSCIYICVFVFYFCPPTTGRTSDCSICQTVHALSPLKPVWTT